MACVVAVYRGTRDGMFIRDAWPTSENPRAGHRIPIADCADLRIAEVVRGRPGRTGLQAGEVGTIREAAPAACGTELRHRELTCEHRTADPRRHLIRASAFTPIAARRIREAACNPACNRAEAQEWSRALGQDCADVAGRNLPLRHACRVQVGTIRRSAQSRWHTALQQEPAQPLRTIA
jgi:hypothetical protein